MMYAAAWPSGSLGLASAKPLFYPELSPGSLSVCTSGEDLALQRALRESSKTTSAAAATAAEEIELRRVLRLSMSEEKDLDLALRLSAEGAAATASDAELARQLSEEINYTSPPKPAGGGAAARRALAVGSSDDDLATFWWLRERHHAAKPSVVRLCLDLHRGDALEADLALRALFLGQVDQLSAAAMAVVGKEGWRGPAEAAAAAEATAAAASASASAPYQAASLLSAPPRLAGRDARKPARAAAASMRAHYARASEVWAKGQRAHSGIVAERGHRSRAAMHGASARAADAIFAQRNPSLLAALSAGSSSGAAVVDLHGLHVAEAKERLGACLELAKCSSLRVVTGRGSNSNGGVSRLRPAVRRYLKTAPSVREVSEARGGGAFEVRLR